MDVPDQGEGFVEAHVNESITTIPPTLPSMKSEYLPESGHSRPPHPQLPKSPYASSLSVPEPGALATPEANQGLAKSIVIVITATFAMIINLANTNAMTIAIPTLQREWDLKPAELQWLISAYPLSSGCLLLVFGRLADLYGRKRIFLTGAAFLATFTLACAFAKDVLTLNILRGFQGIGSAATMPSSLGILAHAFPPSRARSLAFATFAAGAPIGAVFGTAMGGAMAQFTTQTWRSSFYLLSALNVLCIISAWLAVDKDAPSQEADRRTDFIGSFLVTAGLVLIVFVVSQGEIAPQQWNTPYIIALLFLGVLLIGFFLCWQHYLEQIQNDPNTPYSLFTPPPLMKLTIWTRANGRIAAIMSIAFTTWCAFTAWTFWVQLYYRDYLGLSTMDTVVRLVPMFPSGMLCNAFVGIMAARVPLVWILAGGTFTTMIACVLFALIVPSLPYWAVAFPATCLSAVGADFVFTAGTLFIAKFSLPHEQSVVGALFNTMVQLGVAVGITVSTVVFNSVSTKTPEDADQIAPYRAAQWTCAGFGAVATVLAIAFFRGIGVVGVREPKHSSSSSLSSPMEKGSQGQEGLID